MFTADELRLFDRCAVIKVDALGWMLIRRLAEVRDVRLAAERRQRQVLEETS